MKIEQIIHALNHDQVIAYPTEAVFGLGCNPLSDTALHQLLTLKQRPQEKGLILVAPKIEFFVPFLDLKCLNEEQYQRLTTHYAKPTTWVVPAKKDVSPLLRGKFSTLAVRLCDHQAVSDLCYAISLPLVSTSCNLSGQTPAKTAQQVRDQFGEDFFVLDEKVGNALKPSEIRDLVTNQLLRQG